MPSGIATFFQLLWGLATVYQLEVLLLTTLIFGSFILWQSLSMAGIAVVASSKVLCTPPNRHRPELALFLRFVFCAATAYQPEGLTNDVKSSGLSSCGSLLLWQAEQWLHLEKCSARCRTGTVQSRLSFTLCFLRTDSVPTQGFD
jgi:hypothetical protein